MAFTEPEDLARALAARVSEKLGSDIVVLDLRRLVAWTDFLVIASAGNERQADAILDDVQTTMKHGYDLLPVNAGQDGQVGWRVLDYLDCVLHVFTEEARRRYDLEDLWHEAPRLELEETAGPAAD